MRRKIILAAVVAFWVAMTAALCVKISKEREAAFPPLKPEEVFNRTGDKFSKMGIYDARGRLGSTVSGTSISGDEARVANVTELRLPLRMASRCVMHRRDGLKSFDCELSAGPLRLFGRAVRKSEGLALVIEDERGKSVGSFPLGDGKGLSLGLSPFIATPRLDLGARWPIYYQNPLTGGVSKGTAEVKRGLSYRWKGKDVDAFEVRFSAGLTSSTAIVTIDGEVLEQKVRILSSEYTLKAEDVGDEDKKALEEVWRKR